MFNFKSSKDEENAIKTMVALNCPFSDEENQPEIDSEADDSGWFFECKCDKSKCTGYVTK